MIETDGGANPHCANPRLKTRKSTRSFARLRPAERLILSAPDDYEMIRSRGHALKPISWHCDHATNSSFFPIERAQAYRSTHTIGDYVRLIFLKAARP
ncbi:hypothetical protein N015_14245 [Pseudomonas asturiensis]|uniref:Uncharacterized protein n=1 Tax=Pseudomonas asturiensis TaxID=1190415 RepID=A0ABX6HD34_9PSED|nr:hypothetical protein N015_14245 [Pseudomonas asturiensis]